MGSMIAVLALSLSGCTDGSFGRFMDHPITSWLPVDASFLGPSGTYESQAPEQQSYPDSKCFRLARERTNVLDGEGFDQGTLREMFDRTYRSCVESESDGPYSH